MNSKVKREDLLKRLQQIPFTAFLTYMTAEGGLDVKFITPEGVGDIWMEADRWTVYRIRLPEQCRWQIIRAKVASGMLRLEDIHDTELGLLANSILDELSVADSNAVADLFAPLADLPDDTIGLVFCYYDTNEGKLFCYAKRDELGQKLARVYSQYCCKWDTFDTAELQDLLSRYDEEDPIPLKCFDDE